MFPISWYLYLAYFSFMLFVTLKVTEHDETDEPNLWDKYWPVFFAILLAPLSYWYFGDGLKNINGYIALGIALPPLAAAGYMMLETLKEVYYDENEDDDESEEDLEHYNGSVNLIKLTLAAPSAGSNLIDLDSYGKPADPVKQGQAIASLFSSKTDTKTALKSLAELGEGEGSDEDSDDSFLGMLMLWVMLGPLAYYAYSIVISVIENFGWWPF